MLLLPGTRELRFLPGENSCRTLSEQPVLLDYINDLRFTRTEAFDTYATVSAT
ncbi:hypothetical protein [Streptomyces sp. NPDC093248]|uniref:hypothetical protein n=1 Tax=Streptomyces sp. NPDC093248 TaxID=3155072 RepID=UPI0034345D3A